MKAITSLNNKIIKQVISLKSKKYRIKHRLFIVEGERFVSEIPKDREVLYYICSESFYNKLENLNFKSDIYIVSDKIFKKISETENPQGIITVCKMKNFILEEVLACENKHFVILDRVMDPGNLGTIIRTAEAMGFDGVFLSKGCADLYNSKVLRSTMGSIFNIPIFTNCDTMQIIEKFKSKSIKIIATSLSSNKYIYDLNLDIPFAVVIGNEANGVLEEIISKADFSFKIPMLGNVESLNVSTASSIIFYEVIRQKFKK